MIKISSDSCEDECSSQFEGAEYEIWHRHLTILYSKPTFYKVSPKNKTLLDLLENECTSQFKGAEYESDIDTLQFFIQDLNFGNLVPKLKSCWIYLKICTRTNLKAIYKKFISKILIWANWFQNWSLIKLTWKLTY